MRLQESKYFKIEIGKHTLEYEIVTDDVEKWANAKGKINDMVEDFQRLVNNIEHESIESRLDTENRVRRTCISILNVFLGEGFYHKFRKSLSKRNRTILTTNEHLIIVSNLLLCVANKTVAEMNEELGDVRKYARKRK